MTILGGIPVLEVELLPTVGGSNIPGGGACKLLLLLGAGCPLSNGGGALPVLWLKTYIYIYYFNNQL